MCGLQDTQLLAAWGMMCDAILGCAGQALYVTQCLHWENPKRERLFSNLWQNFSLLCTQAVLPVASE